jgi:hypothetical protein
MALYSTPHGKKREMNTKSTLTDLERSTGC